MGSDPVAEAAERGATADAHDLGPALEPAILAACGSSLSDIRWFRTDWQLGGAATAYACAQPSDGEPPRDVVIKIPIGPREYRFLTALSVINESPTPRLAFHGSELGGYDLAWVVMERLDGDPLSAHLHKDIFRRVATVAASFHKCAREAMPIGAPPDPPAWGDLLERARQALRDNPQIPEAQRWANAVKGAQKHLPTLEQVWRTRAIDTWCHGDLHPGNCMARPEGSPWGEAGDILFDLAEVHAGHWVEDAIYLERVYWGTPDALKGVKPVSMLAKARRELGLDTEDDYALLANARRVLMAACVPAFLHREGHPAYMAQALKILERLLPQFD